VDRRRFDYFYIELCCAVEQRLPRYALWLEVAEPPAPTREDRADLLHFIDSQLAAFLADRGTAITPRAHRQLRRRIARHRPEFSTPYEVMARICAPHPG
jgi:hypothetical protein